MKVHHIIIIGIIFAIVLLSGCAPDGHQEIITSKTDYSMIEGCSGGMLGWRI